MDSNTKKQLEIIACKARMGVIEGTFNAKSGHPGGSLSICDVLAYLYFCEMNIDPENPSMPGRDRFVLSKGHAAPALYPILSLRGYFGWDEIAKLRKPHGMLQGHPSLTSTPGVDMSTGSLGQGISAAVGMALSSKHFGDNFRVYAVLGDGEIEEGQVWEAAMFAGNKKLDNLVAFIDYNNLQIDGTVEEVNSPAPIDKKFEAFGWNVITVDAHNFDEIESAYAEARKCIGKPTAIIGKSVKGKGVSFMENQVNWHGAATNAEQTEQALNELKKQLEALNA